MAKARKSEVDVGSFAGFSPAEWKKHMDNDEDWTERLDGASEASVLEIAAALDHDSADVRALACNLAYGLGADGLGGHADRVVERLAAMIDGDKTAKVRARARMVHEGLAGEVSRAAIRRELPWLERFSPDAVPAALAAASDERDAARLQVYLWWANATGLAPSARTSAIETLQRRVGEETDPLLHQAAEIALAHVRR